MELTESDNGTKKKTFYVVNKAAEPGATKNAILHFLYNPETGAVCGRTAGSWFKITVFYIIFYICLGIFSFCMYMLFAKISLVEDRPRWIGNNSLIGSNPGVGFRPMPDQDKNAESTLIWINRLKDERTSYWGTSLDKFLGTYRNVTGNKDCSYDGDQADANKGCKVDLNVFTKCTNETGYGYIGPDPAPCVLIKLNKIFDWKPESYTKDDTLPDDMPKKLQDKIKKLAAAGSNQLKTVWITCQPEYVADREQLGPIEYYSPASSEVEEFGMLPNYYFPYEKQANFTSPFLFVRFPSPAKHVLIQVECRAWALNIKYNRQFRFGSVHFELMID